MSNNFRRKQLQRILIKPKHRDTYEQRADNNHALSGSIMCSLSQSRFTCFFSNASEAATNCANRTVERLLWNFSSKAQEQAVNLRPAPEDVYCTLSVTLVEACAPVLTSVAVTTTV